VINVPRMHDESEMILVTWACLTVLERTSRPGFMSSEYKTFCSGSILFDC
jgi:hypothetical protein